MRQEIEVIKCTVKSRLLPLIYRKRRRRVSLITSHSRACDLHWACVALSGRCVPRDVILTKNTRRKCAGGQIVVASYESQQSPCAFLKASFLSFLILCLSNSSYNQPFSSIQQLHSLRLSITVTKPPIQRYLFFRFESTPTLLCRVVLRCVRSLPKPFFIYSESATLTPKIHCGK